MNAQVLRLGRETVMAALPGQLMVELGLALKQASPFAYTLPIELANKDEYIAIVPPRKSFCEGHFEVIHSLLECGGGEMMVDAAVHLLREVK